jgi:hypothetical protein
MDEFESLARIHMSTQVRETAAIQVALSRFWDQIMDPHDIPGSFDKFEKVAIRLVNAGRTRGEGTAQAYYEQLKVLSGLPETVSVPRQPFDSQYTALSLQSTGRGRALKKIGQGYPAEVALDIAKTAMLGAAKRHTLNAGRQRLLDLSKRDPDVKGWVRVSDGNPCHFCAMLLSRGPVYNAMTSRFRSHDGCGCSARPVLRNDPSGGWTPDALAMRDLWDANHGNVDAFREAYATAA